ncbi:MAG: leucyl aminopeptidase [bacterium]|nr:leucyl aminopeptidase [bacterium]
MITINVSDKKLLDHKVDCYAFGLEEGFSFSHLSPDIKDLEKLIYPDLQLWLSKSNFTGKKLETRVIPVVVNKKVIHGIFVGLGKRNKKAIPIENYRRTIAQCLRQMAQYKGESVAITLPTASLFGVTTEYLAKQTALILTMAEYTFNEFITIKDKKEVNAFEVTLCTDTKNKKAVHKGVKEGECIAHSVNKARHLIDMPASSLTPMDFAAKAREVAKKSGLKITVFDEKQVNEMGMGGLAGVSRGSEQDCCLVVMEYNAPKKTAPTLAFVGKGITFDSGGLSIKPAQYMETMKEDMSGAAAVVAAIEAIAALKAKVNIIALMPLAENLPSGESLKPGDIVKFYNGKTAEVRNTDAEGRLILADALSYAVKHYKPDAIIDLATLTGGCLYALGPFFSALMSQHDDLVKQIENASELSGDRLWRLPLDDDFKPSIQSDVADISNISKSKYGAQTVCASFFLQHFVNDVPWAHLDIAGTAFDVPDLPYYRTGATGVGVRLLVELAMNWK